MTARLDALLKLHHADPDDAELLYMLGLEHAKAQDHDHAVDFLGRAIAAQPGHHYAYYQQAKAHHALDQTDHALATLDAGIARATQDQAAKALGELQELKQTILESQD
ncbi:MAG: tetratricopeptide repeat protein [Planctomycetota bacterium]